jgi:hypothetical protein
VNIPFKGHLELVGSASGNLHIWEHPEPGEKYFLGSDTAEGITGGDWSVGCVIRGSDCAQVAEWRDHIGPTEWGRSMAYLAWYYNEALLAFEAYPAAHGLTAHDAALTTGYVNMYHRKVFDNRTFQQTEKKGWRTDQITKPRMIDRIRSALSDEGSIIRSEFLLRELLGVRYEPKNVSQRDLGSQGWKAVTRTHDDCHDAFAIGLCVRDEHFYTETSKPRPEPEPATLQERVWAQEKEESTHIGSNLPTKRAFDGF